ncbi:MAG: hypothetical protein AAFN40_22715 [Cyanobacteria bacterium J06560_6]
MSGCLGVLIFRLIGAVGTVARANFGLSLFRAQYAGSDFHAWLERTIRLLVTGYWWLRCDYTVVTDCLCFDKRTERMFGYSVIREEYSITTLR